MLSGIGIPSVLGSSRSVSTRSAASEGSFGSSWTRSPANETGRCAFAGAGLGAPVGGWRAARDGSTAMDMLRVRGTDAGAATPAVAPGPQRR